MTANRFRLEVAGQVVVGLAFGSEGELEEFLADRGRGLLAMGSEQDGGITSQIEADEQQPRRGRPSFHGVIAAAVEILGDKLNGHCLADRARCVLRLLAKTCEPSEIPKTGTVRAYLAAHPVAKKSVDKSVKKSKRAMVGRTGG